MRAFYNLWCPSTNTLHTSLNELSISIWVLFLLVDLSTSGFFYNEVSPLSRELFDKRTPQSCMYFFFILGQLADGDSTNVSFEQMDPILVQRSGKTCRSPVRSLLTRKRQQPKVTHNLRPTFTVDCLMHAMNFNLFYLG